MDQSEIEFDKIVIEFLIAARGKLSTSRCSQRLGISFNKYERWENGKTQLSWEDFVLVCKTFQLPLRKALRLSHFYHYKDFQEGSLIMSDLKGTRTITDFAVLMEAPRLSVSRWLSGRTKFSVGDFVKGLHLTRFNVSQFFEHLISPEKMPYLKQIYGSRGQEVHILHEHPWKAVLIGAIGHPEIPTKDKAASFLSQLFGIEVSEIEKTLQEFLRVGIFLINDENFYSYNPNFGVGRLNSSHRNLSAEFWTMVASQTLHALPLDPGDEKAKNISRYFCFSTTEEVWVQIQLLQRQFFEDLVRLVSTADPYKFSDFKVMNLQFMDLPSIGKMCDISKMRRVVP